MAWGAPPARNRWRQRSQQKKYVLPSCSARSAVASSTCMWQIGSIAMRRSVIDSCPRGASPRRGNAGISRETRSGAAGRRGDSMGTRFFHSRILGPSAKWWCPPCRTDFTGNGRWGVSRNRSVSPSFLCERHCRNARQRDGREGTAICVFAEGLRRRVLRLGRVT